MHPADEAWIRWYAAYTGRSEAQARTVLNEYHAMKRRYETTLNPLKGATWMDVPPEPQEGQRG